MLEILLKYTSLILAYLCLCLYTSCQPIPALQSYPSTMQSKRVDFYTSAVTNIPAGSFIQPYDNALVIATSGTYNPIGFISMCALDFVPSGPEQFYCKSLSIGVSSISIQCKIGSQSTINQLSYFYAVFSSSEFVYTAGSSTYSYIVAEQYSGFTVSSFGTTIYYMTAKTHKLNVATYHRAFVFFRGLDSIMTTFTFGTNMTLAINNADYSLIFYELPGLGYAYSATGSGNFHVSVMIYDVSFFQLRRNLNIMSQLTPYSLGIPLLASPTTISTLDMLILGLKSTFFRESSSLTYSFNNNPLFDVAFPVNSDYNELQYIWIKSYSCSPGTYLDRVGKTCFTTRNGCTNFYQTVPNAALSTVNYLKLHSSLKIFIAASSYEVRLYRHNGLNFVLYTSFYIPIQSSQIAKVAYSTDLSRIAILCTGCGFFIYAWDGNQYQSQYMIPSTSTTFIDFNIRNDFKLFTLLYYKSGIANTLQATFTYNNALKTYDMNPQISASSNQQMYINYDRNQSYAMYNQFLDQWKYSNNMKIYQPYLPRTSLLQVSSNGAINTAISGDFMVLAIDYPRTNAYNDYYIKIFQYDLILRKFVFHSRIKSENNVNYGISNALKLSYNGLKLLVKPIASTIQSKIMFTRSSLSDPFTLTQIITVPESTAASVKTKAQMDASDDFKFIISADTFNNIILHYCQSVIVNSTNLYQITTALPLYTEIVTTTQLKIDNLASITTAAGQQIIQTKQQIKNMQDKMQSLQNTNFAIVGIVCIIIVLLAGLIVKMVKGAATTANPTNSNNADLKVQQQKKVNGHDISQNTMYFDKQNYSKSTILPQPQAQKPQQINQLQQSQSKLDQNNQKSQLRQRKKKKKLQSMNTNTNNNMNMNMLQSNNIQPAEYDMEFSLNLNT